MPTAFLNNNTTPSKTTGQQSCLQSAGGGFDSFYQSGQKSQKKIINKIQAKQKAEKLANNATHTHTHAHIHMHIKCAKKIRKKHKYLCHVFSIYIMHALR